MVWSHYRSGKQKPFCFHNFKGLEWKRNWLTSVMKRGVQQASVKKQLPRLGPKVLWLSIHKQELQQRKQHEHCSIIMWTTPWVRVKLLHHRLTWVTKQVTKAVTQIRRWQSGGGITWVVMANCAFSHYKEDAETEGMRAPLGRARAEWSLWFPASQLQRETCRGWEETAQGWSEKLMLPLGANKYPGTVSRSSAGWGVEPSEGSAFCWRRRAPDFVMSISGIGNRPHKVSFYPCDKTSFPKLCFGKKHAEGKY